MFCDFKRNGRGCRCVQCGRVVRKHSGEGLIAACRVPCVHLGELTGSVKVDCETCKGTKEIDQPSHKCAVMRRCLPNYRPPDPSKWDARKPESDIYHLCRGCESFEALPPAPPAE